MVPSGPLVITVMERTDQLGTGAACNQRVLRRRVNGGKPRPETQVLTLCAAQTSEGKTLVFILSGREKEGQGSSVKGLERLLLRGYSLR